MDYSIFNFSFTFIIAVAVATINKAYQFQHQAFLHQFKESVILVLIKLTTECIIPIHFNPNNYSFYHKRISPLEE
jgi:ABC-type metal ion transport system substrate-binding protein